MFNKISQFNIQAQTSFYYFYYLSCYSLISYYSINIINNIYVSNDIYYVIDTRDYYPLVISTSFFLWTDIVYKYYYHPRNTLYYGLFIHHVVSLLGYYLTLYYQLGQLVVVNLSLFELSSIPLLLYSNRICVGLTLPATWLSYLIIRIIWGNLVIYDSLRQLSYIEFYYPIQIIIYICHGFFIIANNFWFMKLSKSYYIHNKRYIMKSNNSCCKCSS